MSLSDREHAEGFHLTSVSAVAEVAPTPIVTLTAGLSQTLVPAEVNARGDTEYTAVEPHPRECEPQFHRNPITGGR